MAFKVIQQLQNGCEYMVTLTGKNKHQEPHNKNSLTKNS